MFDHMRIGKRDFLLDGRPYIMGILNVTPDSFSDGGNYADLDAALRHTEEMIASGADIIDVGGESTRPGHTPVSAGEEIARTCFVIEAIKERFEIPVSLDTSKSKVAEAGILAGADLINDIWGLTQDDGMAEVIAKHKVACCLMHNRPNTDYGDLIEDVKRDLLSSVAIAKTAGVPDEKIMIDPGIGFAKDTKQNLRVLARLEAYTRLGYPLLLGISRKSVIGNTLSLPVEEREEATVALTVQGYLNGALFHRVHDVKKNRRALDMIYAVQREKED